MPPVCAVRMPSDADGSLFSICSLTLEILGPLLVVVALDARDRRGRQRRELARGLGLLAVRAQARGVERVDADVLAVRRGDDRSEPRLDGRRDGQPFAEIDQGLAPGSAPSESTSASSAFIDAWPSMFDCRSRKLRSMRSSAWRAAASAASAPMAAVSAPWPGVGAGGDDLNPAAGELGAGGDRDRRSARRANPATRLVRARSAWSRCRRHAQRPPSAWPRRSCSLQPFAAPDRR